ncbi:hypothetical protein C8R46DRAFT_1357530 [Mycena filopes]|nr:hypothetical protein C8R46DRAFT_1357530 [Mycena filopes]
MDARAPPFSLGEFGDLVSAALASPDIPPLTSALPPRQTRARLSALSSFHHQSPRVASEPAREPPHRRARSPAYRIPELQRLSSFNAFDTTNPQDASAFEPALPLVMQYERVYGQSAPSLPSYAYSSSSPSASSAYTDSSPSTSTCSCSSSNSSYPPSSPMTTLSPVCESSSEDACTSRWSLSSSACSDAEPVFLTKPTETPTPAPTLRRRRTRLSLGLRLHLGGGVLPPAKPVPACPLPPLPFHHSPPPSSDAFSTSSASSHHTFTALAPTPTAPAKSLRSVRSLHSLPVSPRDHEDARSLMSARQRPSARSGRRAPIPSLLDAFPVPPSSVPSSPPSSPSKSASSSLSKRPSSPFPFTRPIPISIPGAYPPSPGSSDAAEEDEDDEFHSACSDAL